MAQKLDYLPLGIISFREQFFVYSEKFIDVYSKEWTAIQKIQFLQNDSLYINKGLIHVISLAPGAVVYQNVTVLKKSKDGIW